MQFVIREGKEYLEVYYVEGKARLWHRKNIVILLACIWQLVAVSFIFVEAVSPLLDVYFQSNFMESFIGVFIYFYHPNSTL